MEVCSGGRRIGHGQVYIVFRTRLFGVGGEGVGDGLFFFFFFLNIFIEDLGGKMAAT